MNILVTGGAGYIGSFMVKRLLDEGNSVVVADSLERGHKDRVDNRARFLQGELLDKNFVEQIFKEEYDAVMHFAGYISVGESMDDPGLYFTNNVTATINILDAMAARNVKRFIFSSTGTVYGTPVKLPIDEEHVQNPENPYAESKLMVERILHWYYEVYGIGYSVLRYFNAAGGAIDGSLGESHDPETHLIPNAIRAVLFDREFALFGDDYKTPDGTCIRDYIHVLDLVDAHILTLNKLKEQNGEYIYNVGTGRGYSNREVLDMVEKVTGSKVKTVVRDRRAGDVAEMVSDCRKIKSDLGFETKHSDIETIIKTAWEWHKNESGK